jgi:uncharacterized metal-binding protein
MNDSSPPDFREPAAGWRGRGLPVVYSCSGCSSSAQLAHYVAVQLDRRGLARMSCVAGLAAEVPEIVVDLLSAPQVIALDACEFRCAKRTVERYGVKPRYHYVVAARSTGSEIPLEDEAERFIQRVLADILLPLHGVR